MQHAAGHLTIGRAASGGIFGNGGLAINTRLHVSCVSAKGRHLPKRTSSIASGKPRINTGRMELVSAGQTTDFAAALIALCTYSAVLRENGLGPVGGCACFVEGWLPLERRHNLASHAVYAQTDDND